MNYLHSNLTQKIINASIEVHKGLGPGLLEKVYEECLYYELNQRDVHVLRQCPIPVFYKDATLDCGFIIDLLVDEQVVVEIKAVEKITDIHLAQLMTYLKLSDCRIGLLINFNVKLLKNGIQRVIL